MRRSNYPSSMTYAQMEHALYMRKRERQADRLVRTLYILVITTVVGVVTGIAALLTAAL